jgi:hypothetical protein
MKTTTLWIPAALVLVFTTATWAGEGFREALREKMKERFAAVTDMRKAAQDFFAAKDAGNRDTATAAAAKAKSLWQGLPENWRKAIEEKHPGTAERIVSLSDEFDDDDGPQTLTREAQATTATGRSLTSTDTVTKDGNTVTHQGTTTTGSGQTVTRDGTLTRDGNTVTHQGSSTTGSGRTSTRADTWQREGNKLSHEGSTTGSRGNTAAREDSLTRDGRSVSRDSSAAASRGASSGFKPSYNDDMDVFGGRPKPQSKSQPKSKPSPKGGGHGRR